MSDHTNCRVHTRREARWEARAARGTGLSAEADWSSDTREWTRIYKAGSVPGSTEYLGISSIICV